MTDEGTQDVQKPRCEYCRTERPLDELKKAKVTYVGSKHNGYKWVKGVYTDENLYCTDKPCATHDQWSREG